MVVTTATRSTPRALRVSLWYRGRGRVGIRGRVRVRVPRALRVSLWCRGRGRDREAAGNKNHGYDNVRLRPHAHHMHTLTLTHLLDEAGRCRWE